MSLDDLRAYFNSCDKPKSLQLDKATLITNFSSFLDSHMSVLERNPGNPSFAGFHYRLEQAYHLLSGQQP